LVSNFTEQNQPKKGPAYKTLRDEDFNKEVLKIKYQQSYPKFVAKSLGKKAISPVTQDSPRRVHHPLISKT
jgi:hypothetical protein